MLSLSTFGPPRISWHGIPVAGISSGKSTALLIYLAMRPGQHRREAIADIFWPQQGMNAARLSLRQAVFQLRTALAVATGHSFIESGRHYIGFDASHPHRLDAIDFLIDPPECANASANTDACLQRMAALIDLYKGPFLADIVVSDCPEFDEWLQLSRESLHRRALDLLVRLADGYGQKKNYRAALPFALRYTELEPWTESGYARTMQLYAQDGRHAAALQQYEACTRVLERELGVRPNAELQALAQKIRRHEIGPADLAATSASRFKEERRQVTAMYLELHATRITDVEAAMESLKVPQLRCQEIIQQHHGHIVQAHGGGLLCYFGYPRALENTALTAVRTAIKVAAEATPELEIRIGVHSGLIVTAGDPRIPDPVGMTSNIAIRLRQLAASGEVVVSEATQQRVAGYFDFTAINRRKVRGLPLGHKSFKVTGETGATHRLAAASQLTPFVGREAKLARVTEAWMQARQGKFQVVLLTGEAGIGKSRLVSTFAERLADGSGLVRELRCFPEATMSPLRPIITLFESLCGFVPKDARETKLSKLENLLRMRTPQLAEGSLPVLSWMLELTETASSVPADNLMAMTGELLIALLYAVAERQPVLVVVEDLHWADTSTLEVLTMLMTRRTPAPILVLLTARPEWTTKWPDVAVVEMPPLPDAAIADMVRSVHRGITTEQLGQIVARADGVPLFAEELAAGMDDSELPATLLDLLTARLDAISSAREIAQLAASAGREFDLAFLIEVCDLPPGAVQEAVAKLQDAGLTQPLRSGSFQFKHALIQEAIYETQTKTARKAAHRRLAEVLQAGYGNIARQRPEVLAQHWTAADDAPRAIDWWFLAGRHAAKRFAHPEAIAHYAAGERLLAGLAPGAERDQREFNLLVSWVQSEQMTSGYGGERSEELLRRAAALLERRVGHAADVFQAMWGQWEGASSRTGHHEARRIAEQLLTIARNENDRALMQQAHYATGVSLFWTGELANSRRHLEQSIALEEKDTRTPTRNCYGHVMRVAAEAYLSWVLWLQGQTDMSLTASNEALTLARSYGDLHAETFALTFAATLRRWHGDTGEASRLAEEGRQASSDCNNPVFGTVCAMISAWAEAMQGNGEAVAALDQGISAIRQSYSGTAATLLTIFADALLHLGMTTDALVVAEDALEQATARHETYLLAEIHRLSGLCRRKHADVEAARECFETAIAISRAQENIALELRATKDLSALLQQSP